MGVRNWGSKRRVGERMVCCRVELYLDQLNNQVSYAFVLIF